MKLSSLISSGTRELVDRLRPHLDVTIDLFDADLSPLLPEATTATRRSLRPGTDSADVLGADQSGQAPVTFFRAAVRTASTQFFTADGRRVGLFPIRHGRTVVGIVATTEAVVPPTPLGPGGSGRVGADHERGSEDGSLERLGWSLRATIEADIETHGLLGGARLQSRWLTTAMRLVEHLLDAQDEQELTDSLIQAAAVWGDLDARLYRQTVDRGAFALHSLLPSLQATAQPRRIPAGLIANAGTPCRMSSISELEQLGWTGPHAEVLFLAPSGLDEEWLLVVGGKVDPSLERVLTVALKTLSIRMSRTVRPHTISSAQPTSPLEPGGLR